MTAPADTLVPICPLDALTPERGAAAGPIWVTDSIAGDEIGCCCTGRDGGGGALGAKRGGGVLRLPARRGGAPRR